MSLIDLNFVIREDPWGMIGSQSVIGDLLLEPSNPLREKKVGEAWCGTHAQRPAQIKGRNENLLELIQNDAASILGQKLAQKEKAELPFLFKILTIATPLSLQVHPDLKKAIELSKRFPSRYPDSTEKPEVGIAITETKLLLGFRKLEEIVATIKGQAPAQSFFKSELQSPSIASIYKKFLCSSETELTVFNQAVQLFLQSKKERTETEELFLQLYTYFPNDLGPYQSFLLNLVTLKPGEGIFIPPNTVHAYLSGQLLECMGTSDFVIRAGLTPKEKDIPSLLEVISYDPFIVSKAVPKRPLFEFSPFEIPPAPFRIEKFTGKCANEVLSPDSPVMYFCLRGSGQISASESTLEFAPGSVCLVYAGSKHLIALDGEFYRILVDSDT